MPEVENLNRFLTLIDPVVDQHGGMENLTHVPTPRNRRSDVGKILQKLDVVQKRGAETVRGRFIVGADVIKNTIEVS